MDGKLGRISHAKLGEGTAEVIRRRSLPQNSGRLQQLRKSSPQITQIDTDDWQGLAGAHLTCVYLRNLRALESSFATGSASASAELLLMWPFAPRTSIGRSRRERPLDESSSLFLRGPTVLTARDRALTLIYIVRYLARRTEFVQLRFLALLFRSRTRPAVAAESRTNAETRQHPSLQR